MAVLVRKFMLCRIIRGLAQSDRAVVLGTTGHWFKSNNPDQEIHGESIMDYEFKHNKLGLGTSWFCTLGHDIKMTIQHDYRTGEVNCWRVNSVYVGSYRIVNDNHTPYSLTFEQSRQRAIKMMNLLHDCLNIIERLS